MIEQMKKITVVCLAERKEQSLQVLQKLASVHILPAAPPASVKLDALKRDVARMDALMMQLEEAAGTSGDATVDNAGAACERDGRKCMEEAIAASDCVRSCEEHLPAVLQAMEKLEPWGDFSLEVPERLKKLGWNMVLCSCDRREMPELPEDAIVHTVNQRDNTIYFAVFSRSDLASFKLPAVTFPGGSSLAELRRQAEELRRNAEEARCKLLYHAANSMQLLEEVRRSYASELTFESACSSMGSDGRALAYLTGYVPVRQLDRLRSVCRDNGCAIRYEDVAPDDPEVPTSLDIPKQFRMAKVVLDFIGLVPGYNEVDVSVSVLMFLALFCGMLIGDAGYGVIFTGLAAYGYVKALRSGDARSLEAGKLMLVMALCVFGWGAITGNWFGLQWGGLSWFTDDKDSQHIKLFCFFLGAGHMVLAHLWKSRLVHGLRERLANIGWAMFLGGNFFTVKALLIDNGDFSNFTIPKWLYIIGTALILLCGINWRKAGDVINAPFTFINSFGDLLSYIRLFAVGLSSLEIARAFNEMGATIWNGNVWLIPVGVLVILLGHALNISLALMGVLVHGIRLNTLEFSGHIGVEWSGKPYEPFK